MRDQIDSDSARSVPLTKAERGSWILGAQIFLNASLNDQEPCFLALLVGKGEGRGSGLVFRVYGFHPGGNPEANGWFL